MIPLISVLMPVYNTETFILQAIESILNQSFSDFELIIVDDGSTDNSLAIAKQYANTDSRISVFSQANQGISKTRNYLVSLANSEYIAWMDSDDVSMPLRLKKQYDYFQHHENLIAIGTKSLMIDEQDLPICIWESPLEHEEIDRWHIEGRGGAIIFPSSMMRKQAVQNLGGFDENLTGAEDLSLFLKLAEVGRLENINDVLLYYRQHIKSISHTDKDKVLIDKQLVIDSAYERRGMKSKSLGMNSMPSREIDTYIKWGWWALQDQNVSTSRKYAIKAMLVNPFRFQVWKLLVCSLRGY